MGRVFITGSTEGLGLAAASALIEKGHDVVVHARNHERAVSITDLAERAAGIVIGDLASARETHNIADQVNRLGRMDAVIHNAGVYLKPGRGKTAEGHATTLAVNVLAPYMLTALIERPDRIIYLGSSMHLGADASLHDMDWNKRAWQASLAYSESKLYVAALAAAVARHWPGVLSNCVDPGWVPTRMGGPSAPGDLELGHLTQIWLAVSNTSAAMISGKYWHHRRQIGPAPEVRDPAFQDRLVSRLAELTGVALF